MTDCSSRVLMHAQPQSSTLWFLEKIELELAFRPESRNITFLAASSETFYNAGALELRKSSSKSLYNEGIYLILKWQNNRSITITQGPVRSDEISFARHRAT